MTKTVADKTIVRHALCWGAAMVAPPIALVVLDLVEKHTPTTVALASSMALLFFFSLSHALLVSGLKSISSESSS